MEPVFVFDSPQLGENIGAAARAMRNFGLARMRIVSPRNGWPNADAVATASGAARILDDAAIFEDLASCLADMNYVLATTARKRDLTKPVLDPEQAMSKARRRIAAGASVAVLFGPERSGLTNKAAVFANALVRVPANPSFNSLNLSQCALIMGYEWMLGGCHLEDLELDEGRSTHATVSEKRFLAQRYIESLDAAGFFLMDQKRSTKSLNLHNLFLRHDFSKAEVKTLHGIRRFLLKGGGHTDPEGRATS